MKGEERGGGYQSALLRGFGRGLITYFIEKLCCSCQICFELTVINVLKLNIYIIGEESDKASQSLKISFTFALPGLFVAVWAPLRVVFGFLS